MSGWTQGILVTVCAAAILLAGCGGSSALPAPSLTEVEHPTATVGTPIGHTATPRARATPMVNGPAAPCRVEDLAVASRGPGGATAMMSLAVDVANVGTLPCVIAAPVSARFLDASDGHLLAASSPANKRHAPLTLNPTHLPVQNDPDQEPGAGYIWLLWNWRINTACVVYDPPSVTVVVAFPEFELQTGAPVKFGPCEGQVGIAGFALILPKE